ncbi:hydantoinase/oxoprolinase family protein [Gaopeijia maritima]|uniref:Hydantoinase/oxoprolinase family protein n=1 Tax=Gaopeijia maritima TaxID=3119007 RepID=A0ABU9E5D7_9BACT
MADGQPRRRTVDGAPDGGKPLDRVWVAVDTGGTFTDVVAWGADGLRTLKLPSTPDDPSRAILDGLARIAPDATRLVLLHGSTVATNALLEGRGAAVTLITNRGFEDVLAIGRQNRPQLYALVGHRPPPLVPAERRLGIAGRLAADATELEPLDESELADLAARVRATGAESVAVCLLHAYADGAHEQRVGRALEPLGLPLSISSELLPEYREYERTSTTVVNASVAPVMSRYLRRLEAEAGAERVAVMGSNGGTLAVERAAREPAHTVLSGPAGGVVGALEWARRAGHPSILTFDMGGTSTDVSLCPGRPLHTREFEIDGRPVALPVLDIHTVGAGGGSIARVDPGGALRVGPESAGAVPGPICYGRGGTEVTVTDAHLWLGRIPADAFLGGEGGLDRAAVEGPLRRLADGLGTSLDAAAEGVLAVADAAMERALRVISVERGYDPRDFALVAFGGAGALHAGELAGRLGCDRALIPPDPGLLSAWGILTAPLSHAVSRTLLAAADRPDTTRRVDDARAGLTPTATEALVGDGADPERIEVRCEVDARYRGQSFELRVGADEGDDWAEAFHAAHAARYGYRRDDAPVEVVTVRVTATAPGTPVVSPAPTPVDAPATRRARTVVVEGRALSAPSVWRRDLGPGHRLNGPALVLDYSATTWVPPEWRVEVDEIGVLHLRSGAEPTTL